jgi:hypothetical protein
MRGEKDTIITDMPIFPAAGALGSLYQPSPMLGSFSIEKLDHLNI